jgi:hypothetical protein
MAGVAADDRPQAHYGPAGTAFVVGSNCDIRHRVG